MRHGFPTLTTLEEQQGMNAGAIFAAMVSGLFVGLAYYLLTLLMRRPHRSFAEWLARRKQRRIDAYIAEFDKRQRAYECSLEERRKK